MTQYLLLIHNNTESDPQPEDWSQFFTEAQQSGMFKGGSALGERSLIGNAGAASPTDRIGGYMRFDSDDRQKLLELLARHPVVLNGGAVELCEMPKT